MKIDPVNVFVQQRLGHWGDAILLLGARRAESSTRAQTLAGIEARSGLRRHPDLPRVWVSNPIEYLSTEEVWAYLLQRPNPWAVTTELCTNSTLMLPTAMSDSNRYKHAELRQFSFWLLDVHGRRSGQSQRRSTCKRR